MLLAKRTTNVFVVLALLLSSMTVFAADVYAPQKIDKEERCPVCGMYPANYPDWHSQIVFKDGKHSSFDSQMDMFRFLQNMAKYDKNHSANDIGMIYVLNYVDKTWLDARKAFFVSGSKINGPMGSDLPAFASKEQAMVFTKKSGGTVLTFQQVTSTVVNSGHMDMQM